MTDDSGRQHRPGSRDGSPDGDTTDRDTTSERPESDSSGDVDFSGEETMGKVWLDRLENYRSELAETSAPDRRAKLIEKIRKVENGLVKEGHLSEDERGDYTVEPQEPGHAPEDGRTDRDTAEPETASDRPADGTERGAGPTADAAEDTDSQEDESTETRESSGPAPPSHQTADDQSDTGETQGGSEPADQDGQRAAPDAGSDTGTRTSAGSADGAQEPSSAQDESVSEQPESTGESGIDTGDRSTDEPRDRTRPENDPGPERGEAATDSSDTAREAETEDGTAVETDDTQPSAGDDSDGDDTETPAVTREEFDALSESVEAVDSRLDELEELFSEFKRANEHEHAEIRKYSVEEFAGNMLRVRDTLQRAIELFDWEAEKRSRMEAVVDQFDQQFTAREIDVIEPDPGVPFEFGKHEVVGRESAPAEEDEILRVERRGFTLSGRVIRPAQVVVATGTD